MQRTRQRICHQKCVGDNKQLQATYIPCADETRGNWGSWSPWTIIGSEKIRTRKCNIPKPYSNGNGKNCVGTYIQRKIFRTKGINQLAIM